MSESLKLPIELHSPEDIGKVLLELRTHLGKLRDRTVRRKVAGVTGEAMPELSAVTTAVLQDNSATPANIAAIEKVATQLEALRAQLPIAHLTLAELPDKAQRQQFATWFRQRIHPQALLTFSARNDLGGGVIVRVSAIQHDYSFRAQLLANKQKISEIVARG